MRTVVIVCIAVIIFGVIIFLISRRVVTAMNSVMGDVEALAEGDLKNEAKTASLIKEIKQIGNNVEKLSAQLNSIASSAKKASMETGNQAKDLSDTLHDISQTTETVSSAVREMAKGAGEQAETVQKATENISVLSDAIQTVADNSEQLATAAAQKDICRSRMS